MKRDPVESSNLASVGYDADNKILEIEFNHGGVYQYFDVPQDVYDELMDADSYGKYFVHNIKDEYEYDRIK
ncbi:MAG: KTSC domain-containing protein [Bacteroidales bacterium]|nr:KTSC domain-containing protein [Bacteroidales bacterium]